MDRIKRSPYKYLYLNELLWDSVFSLPNYIYVYLSNIQTKFMNFNWKHLYSHNYILYVFSLYVYFMSILQNELDKNK